MLVLYVYTVEVERRNWNVFFAELAFWAHDMKSIRSKLWMVGSIYTVDAICLIVFGALLGWL